MHFNALFLLCAFLAVCSELAAYPGNPNHVRSRSLRRSLSRVIARRGYSKYTTSQPRYHGRTDAAGVVHPEEVYVPVPEVHVPAPEVHAPVHEVHASVPEVHVPVPEVHASVPEEHEIHVPVSEPEEENVHFVEESEVFVHLPESAHEVPTEHEHEVIPHKIEVFPSESGVFEETHVSPPEYEELPLVEEPVVHEPTPKAEDLSVLYDYIYPMVLRKCLASAIHGAMGATSEDNDANYNHQMKFIDHPLVQISGLDTLEELRKNITVVAAARRFSSLPKMTSGCVFHFKEIDADIHAAKEELVISHAESVSEEAFRLDNKFVLKHERLFKKEFMMHLIIRKLYQLLKNHTSIYELMHAMDADLEKYIKYWNTKHQ